MPQSYGDALRIERSADKTFSGSATDVAATILIPLPVN